MMAADQMSAAARSWLPPASAERTALTIGEIGWCSAKGRSHAGTSSWSLRGSGFEQRVALGFGEVILWGVVDAYPVSAQKGGGRPHVRAEQSAQQVQLTVRLQGAPKKSRRFTGGGLRCGERDW